MATRTGVSVFTWGSNEYSSDPMEYDTGMSHFAKTQLFGGNVGHASVLLALPDTEENRQLVTAHLGGTGIPVETKKYETKEVEFVDGKPIKTDRNAYEESVIEVYFSWWPNAESNGFAFNTFSTDCISERSGVHTEFSPEWKEYLEPEERRVSSGVMSRITTSMITLQAANVVHERGYTPDELSILRTSQSNQFNNNLYHTAYSLLSKLDEIIKSQRTNQPLSVSTQLMVRKIFPNQEMDLTDLKLLRTQVEQRMNEIVNLVNVSTFNYVRALAKINPLEHDLTENENKIYNKLQKIRSLHEALDGQEFAILNNLEKKQINDLLATTYPVQFPHGVTSDNIDEIAALVKKECDPELFTNNIKEIAAKGDRKIINQCIDDIDCARDLFNKINAFENADEANKESAKNVMLESLEKIPNLNNLYNSGGPFNEEYVPFIKGKVENLIIPSKNGRYFKTFNDVMNYPGNDFMSSLLNDRAKIVLQEGMVEGHRPTHKVDIPLHSSSVNGLEPEAMLEQMALFANQRRAFNIVNNNCSVTTSAILARGAKEQGWVFEQGAFGNSIANPQMVYNNAVQFASSKKEELLPPVISLYTSAQNYFAGRSIHHTAEAINPEASRMSRIGNALGALSSGIFASAMMIANKFGEGSEAHFEDLAPVPRKTQPSVNPLHIDPSIAKNEVSADDTSAALREEKPTNNPLRLQPLAWSYANQKDSSSVASLHPTNPAEEKHQDHSDTERNRPKSG